MKDMILKKFRCNTHQMFFLSNCDLLVYLIILFNFILYIFIQDLSYQNFFPYNQGDKGVIYQILYNTVVHGQFFYSSINGGAIDTGRFILLIFIPFFYIYPDPITVSIISSFLISIGALPVYWLAKKSGLTDKNGLIFVCLYFLFPSISWLYLESVKEIIFALPFLTFAFYFLYVKSFKRFLIFLFLIGICKINAPLILIMFGVYAFLENYEKKWILAPIILGSSLISFQLLFLNPYFKYLSMILYEYNYTGFSLNVIPRERFAYITHNPVEILSHLFSWDTISYLFILLIPFCFISLLKPKILILGIPVFLENLLSDFPPQQMINWHYVTIPTFVIICSAVLAFSSLDRKLSDQTKKLILILFIVSSIVSFINFSAISDTIILMNNYNNEYQGKLDPLGISQNNSEHFLQTINEIPHNASIFSSLHFGPYIFKNSKIKYYDWNNANLSDNYDYILFKTSVFQNYDMYMNLFNLSNNNNYEILYYDNKIVIIHKIQKFKNFVRNFNPTIIFRLFAISSG